MAEPPILPGASPNFEGPHPTDAPDSENPYASVDIGTLHHNEARVELPIVYWCVLLCLIVLFTLAAFASSGVALPGIVALVAASIRVPLLQLRLSRRAPDVKLPKPLLLLLTSWVFMLVAGFAACAAFVAICIPSGLIVFNSSGGEETAVTFVLGISGLAALAAYILLFVLSLRLPM